MQLPRRLVLSCGFFAITTISIALLLQVLERPVFAQPSSEGSLQVMRGGKPAGFCPLRHTDVKASISGFIARVVVTQEFTNPSSGAIEAVYTFPLPQDAAVDDMTIQAGTRTIRGMIKPKEEAAAIYANAVAHGQMAALLDQERPNIFTQKVGNIPPGTDVRVTISYLARLKYEDGTYEFAFPMVVGPRYIPGKLAIGHQGGGWAADTNKVPDASKITPPVVSPGKRAGHDISLSVALDAGVPIQGLRSPSHDIDLQTTGANSATVRLRNENEIPNKDFILRYAVAGAAIAEGLLTHTVPMPPHMVAASTKGGAQTNGYFTLVIQPPARFQEADVAPKEVVFVLDSSGSMNGFPEEKSKRLIQYAIDGLYPGDTFNVIKFSGDTAVLFDEPVYPTAENVRCAKEFVNSEWGGGGTEMMTAIRAALAPSDSQDHIRIVVFLTDGFVGNDMEIISEIQKHPNARVFAYGIGSSPNRFLLDKMAEAGHGVVEYVSQKEDNKEAEAVAHRLYERLRAPLLTDISLDFGSLPVADVYPKHIPDLFSAKPVVVTGRYTAGATGTIRLAATRANERYTREIPVTLSAQNQDNEALASLWARDKIDDLMSQDWSGLQGGNMRDDLRKEITQTGLDYRLMTQFTSFVAVEEQIVNDGGQPKRIQVPVELPEGVQYEEGWSADQPASPAMYSPMPPSGMVAYRAKAAPGRVSSPQGIVAYDMSIMKAEGAAGGVMAPAVAPSTTAGIGSGSGGGIGSGVGPSVGPGSGGGYGGGYFRVGGSVQAPRATYAPAPQYSDAAIKANLKGTVLVRAVVDVNGKPSAVRLTRGLGMGLDEKTLDAVRTWKFEPAKKDGKVVPSQIIIEIAFANGTSKVTIDPFLPDADLAHTSDTRVRAIETKFHPRLIAAYDCWQTQQDKAKAPAACKLQGDKLLVQVILAKDSATASGELKALGFDLLPGKTRPRQLIGRIAVTQLAALAHSPIVQFVAPASGNYK
jgi:Ca-activated chloride channel homolog